MADQDAAFFDGDPDFATLLNVDVADFGSVTLRVESALCVIIAVPSSGVSAGHLVPSNYVIIPASAGAVAGSVTYAVEFTPGKVRLGVTALTDGGTYQLKYIG